MLEPVMFPQVNTNFGAEQPQYKPLPGLKFPTGEVVTCWELSDEDILDIMKHKKVWVKQHTLNQPLQPIAVSIDSNDFFIPIKETEENPG